MDRLKGSLSHLLRLNTIQNLNTTFDNITCNTHFPCEGGARSKQDRFKRTPTFARSRNKFFGDYTSYDFVTAIVWCAITPALQLSTSIYRGLLTVPKVEHFFLSKPSFSVLYLLERRSACMYTSPSAPRSTLKVFHHHFNHRI